MAQLMALLTEAATEDDPHLSDDNVIRSLVVASHPAVGVAVAFRKDCDEGNGNNWLSALLHRLHHGNWMRAHSRRIDHKSLLEHMDRASFEALGLSHGCSWDIV